MRAPKPNPEQATRWDCAQFAAPRCFAGELEGELGSSVLHLQDGRIWEAVCYEVVQQNLMLSSSGSAIPRGGITQNVAGTSCLQAIVACKCPYINPACSPASGSLKNHAGGSHSSFPTPTSALLLGSGVLWGGSGASQGSVLSITEAGNGSLAFPAIKRGAEVLQKLAGTSAH